MNETILRTVEHHHKRISFSPSSTNTIQSLFVLLQILICFEPNPYLFWLGSLFVLNQILMGFERQGTAGSAGTADSVCRTKSCDTSATA
ncbi:hypothetical protein LJC72_06140, partial [Bacteroides sp. OttesenSCG-928-D19]|nr:hypothetical protein [Bacteroides sp. OttesenSCG-928-D19]